jgi:AcrR family transcriptional regulator
MNNEQRPAAKIGRPAKAPGEKQTKERVFEASIELFSVQGYDKTSMRQIASSVGLTESAVYRHYPGKKAILDAIFEYAEGRIFTPMPIERDQGEEAGESIFRGLLLPLPRMLVSEPLIIQISRIMYAEMLHSEEIRSYYRQTFVERADDYIEALFKKQIEQGAIRPCDPRALARVFNSFRSDWTVQNFILERGRPLGVEELERDLEAPILFFEQFLSPGRKIVAG